ncbi:MAG: hypothetical protein IT196_10535 [Acidimicrobiales bacterium]|nr:hypothetical protein [Acidimicrobiales bacterium]
MGSPTRMTMRGRLSVVAVAVLFGVLLTGARDWQVGAIGVGFLLIGLVLLVQRRRARPPRQP